MWRGVADGRPHVLLRASLLLTGSSDPWPGCPTGRALSPVEGRVGRFPRGGLGSNAVSASLRVCPRHPHVRPHRGRPGLQMLGTRVGTSGQTFRGAHSQGPSVGPPPPCPGPGAADVPTVLPEPGPVCRWNAVGTGARRRRLLVSASVVLVARDSEHVLCRRDLQGSVSSVLCPLSTGVSELVAELQRF